MSFTHQLFNHQLFVDRFIIGFWILDFGREKIDNMLKFRLHNCFATPFRSTPLTITSKSVFYSRPAVHISRSMSSKRTVSDVLMGAARAAAGKRSKNSTNSNSKTSSLPSPTPSPKKPKTLDTTVDSKPQEEDDKKKKPLSSADSPQVHVRNFEVEIKKKGSDFNHEFVASWKNGEPVPFLFLARALDLISGEPGRIAITDMMCNVFRTVISTTPGDLLAVVYLSANKIAPPHDGVELGIGDSALIKSLADAYGRREEHVKNQFKVRIFSFCCF